MMPQYLSSLFWIVCLSVFQPASGYADSKETNNPHIFGAIADCQYCDVQGQGVRKYSLSEDKLKDCVNHFNTMDLEYVIHLGDFIDRDFKSFDVVAPIYNQLSMPRYHVLGNHDFSVTDDVKKDVPKKLEMDSKYYDFQVKGWRCVVLDGNDIGFNAYPSNSPEYAEATEYYEQNNISRAKWNGAIGARQFSWLRTVLENAEQRKEKVILFCHFPVYPESNHTLWNAGELISVLEAYPCVKAYINGHNHAGNYGMKKGIHYLTLKGMVDTEQTSYAVISVSKDTIHVTGYGREENRIMMINERETYE